MHNPFQFIGKTDAEVCEKIQNAYAQLFQGDSENERICFDHHALKYIVDIGHSDVRSEGMSYGMYISARLGEQETFHALWSFTKQYLRNRRGDYAPYFAWQVGVPNKDHANFYKMDRGAAPDGEEYIAAALLIAAKKFGIPEYKREAVSLLKQMLYKKTSGKVRSMFDKDRAMVRFSPMEGNDYTDPSYHTLAFYRLFAEATQDPIWERIYKNSVTYLKKALHPETGLAADYSEFDGTPKFTDFNPMSGYFSGDAWRVALNLALDYTWEIPGVCEEAREDAKKMEQDAIRRLLKFFDAHRPYFSDCLVDGSDYPENARPQTTGLIAMNAAATSALDLQNPNDIALAKPFLLDLWNTPIPTGTWRYYDGLLYLLGYLALNG